MPHSDIVPARFVARPELVPRVLQYGSAKTAAVVQRALAEAVRRASQSKRTEPSAERRRRRRTIRLNGNKCYLGLYDDQELAALPTRRSRLFLGRSSHRANLSTAS